MKHSNETITETGPETGAATGEPPTALDWRDGDMPYSLAFDDHFYCQTDGRLECGHVFLSGNGLPERWLEREGVFRIGELGFGTGLNLCETWRQWKEARNGRSRLHFISFELYPMKAEEIDRALSRWPEVDAERKALTALWPAEPKGRVEIQLDDETQLTVVCGEALMRHFRKRGKFRRLVSRWLRTRAQSGHVVAGDHAGAFRKDDAGRHIRHLCRRRIRSPQPHRRQF